MSIAVQQPAHVALLLARAVDVRQRSRIGDQAGGRVFLFLHTDVFWRDYRAMLAARACVSLKRRSKSPMPRW